MEVVNKEIALYNSVAPKVKLNKIWKLLGLVPHSGQTGLIAAYDDNIEKNAFVLTLGRRAQTLDTLIHTPKGLVALRDLKLGQEINDVTGGTQLVTELHPIIEDDVYRVTLQSGGFIDVNEEHLFTVLDHHKRERVLPVKHLIKYYVNARSGEFAYKIKNPEPLYKEPKELPTDPYTFGLLIEPSSSIPKEYLEGSLEQRLELLRGLLSNSLEYVTASPKLADDVTQLAKSLGCNVAMVEDQLSYRLCITDPRELVYNYISKIEKLPEKQAMRCISVSSPEQLYVVNDYVVTHNSGKSVQAGVIAIRELLIPYSSTILLAPTYRNSKIIFDAVYSLVMQLKLPIKSLNKNQFTILLENGSSFSALTESNVEAGLGSRCSLLIVDESQSFSNLIYILEAMIGPMLLDYGANEVGVLNANMVFLGTPRGVGTEFHELFLYEKTRRNWEAFSAPSSCNPLLPKAYLEEQRNVLSERAYQQEIEAKWLTAGAGVFYSFDEAINTYDPDELDLRGASYILGHDFGTSDSTALVYVKVSADGTYYVHDCYMRNSQTTKGHHEAFLQVIGKDKTAERLGSYGDPSAAQSMLDLRNTYNYDIQKGYNRIAPSISILNDLFEPQGINKKPKLYINKELGELITQIQLIAYKNDVGAQVNVGDPFKKHKEHHFDLIHAMRYAIATHYRQNLAGIAVMS